MNFPNIKTLLAVACAFVILSSASPTDKTVNPRTGTCLAPLLNKAERLSKRPVAEVIHNLKNMKHVATTQISGVYQTPAYIRTEDGRLIDHAVIKYSTVPMEQELIMHELLSKNPLTRDYVPEFYGCGFARLKNPDTKVKEDFINYLLMEDLYDNYVPLENFQKEGNEKQYIQLIAQMAEIMRRFHAIGIVHKDFYITNFFYRITKEGILELKVIDFGRTAKIGTLYSPVARHTNTANINKPDIDYAKFGSTLNTLRHTFYLRSEIRNVYTTYDGRQINLNDFFKKLFNDYKNKTPKPEGYADWIYETAGLLLSSKEGPFTDIHQSA